jgi:polysaccharide biosynthesis protein PslH
MRNILLLVHRLPYPPNKGDKVRSYHLLKHLAQNNRVFLGTFIDDPADKVHLDTVRAYCADVHAATISPIRQKIVSLLALLTGQAMSLRYYHHGGLHTWVKRAMTENQIDAIVVFSSAMGQYAQQSVSADLLVDFVDVDSAKWTQYAANHRWPLSWMYAREGQKLLAYERELAARAKRSFFVTENETQLFRQHAPECADLVEAMSNGVDADFFSPDPALKNPFEEGGLKKHSPLSVVFTGAMDYWPNVDAVTWFVSDILPLLRKKFPQSCFYIVGRSPAPAVLALASDDVVVTGTVDDVRPYLQHATVVVAPLRLARGIQNKILEAMAMARPVVASLSCVEAIHAVQGSELAAAESATEFVAQIEVIFSSPQQSARLGIAARQRVVQDYSWGAHMSKIDKYLVPRPNRPIEVPSEALG